VGSPIFLKKRGVRGQARLKIVNTPSKLGVSLEPYPKPKAFMQNNSREGDTGSI